MKRSSCVVAAVVCLGLLLPAPVRAAEKEVGFVIGALLAGELDNVVAGDGLSLSRSFDDAPVYGVRAGWFGYPLGAEVSIVYSPTGLNASLEDDLIDIEASTLYAELSGLLIIIPGPVSPFVAGGFGYHRLDFSADIGAGAITFDGLEVGKLGYHYGVGLKANLSRISLRVDARDHVTTFDARDLLASQLADLVDLGFDETLHNVEVSFGVGVRF